MKYSDLKLIRNQETKEIQFGENTINVLQYLPIEDKIDIITQAVQDSFSYDTYIDAALEAFWQVYTVFYYTDLEFTDNQKENIFRLYDEMSSNGLLKTIMEAIPQEEISEIWEGLYSFKISKEQNFRSLAIELRDIVDRLPKNFEEMSKAMENFNPEAYQNIMNFAESAGNR